MSKYRYEIVAYNQKTNMVVRVQGYVTSSSYFNAMSDSIDDAQVQARMNDTYLIEFKSIFLERVYDK